MSDEAVDDEVDGRVEDVQRVGGDVGVSHGVEVPPHGVEMQRHGVEVQPHGVEVQADGRLELVVTS